MNEKIRAALIAQTRQIGRANGAEFDKRQLGRELARIRSKADVLIAQIERTSIHIEDAHDLRFGPHALQTDLRDLQEIIDRIAGTAARVTDEMNARSIGPVRIAVQAWLHVEAVLFNHPHPSLYEDGSDVAEIFGLLVEALGEDGAPQESAVRKALAVELTQFDPHCPHERIRLFLDWARDKI
jgi:hypothetical protein